MYVKEFSCINHFFNSNVWTDNNTSQKCSFPAYFHDNNLTQGEFASFAPLQWKTCTKLATTNLGMELANINITLASKTIITTLELHINIWVHVTNQNAPLRIF